MQQLIIIIIIIVIIIIIIIRNAADGEGVRITYIYKSVQVCVCV